MLVGERQLLLLKVMIMLLVLLLKMRACVAGATTEYAADESLA